jgi:sensor c-di-GMP phosphodiesterase-like protein
VVGYLLATLLFVVISWYQRDAVLENNATVILERANDLVRETRTAITAVRALTTEPCSPDDLAAMRLIAINLFYLMDIGRGHDGQLLCDIIHGTQLPVADLGPPDFKSRLGLKVWVSAALFRNSDLRSIVADGGGVMTFSRPIMFHDMFGALGDANAIITSVDGSRLYAWSDNRGGPSALPARAAAEPPGWFEHRISRCDDEGNLCVTIRGAAHFRILPMLTPVGLTLMTGGSVVGLMGYALVAATLSRRRTMISRLRRAIRNDEIHLLYQPLVRLSDRGLVGVEALARWRLRSGEMVSPDIFIPMAERHGLIRDHTANIVARALRELSCLLKSGTCLYVSLNISVQDLLSDGLREHLAAECERNGIARDRIALEITERATDEMGRIGAAVRALRESGFRVCLDDFGTGYSSLGYLAELPIDKIKVDKLFTRAIGTSFVGTIVLRQICAMVKTLELRLVFEGVETEEQAAALLAIEPSAIGQGWLFGKPMTAADVDRFAAASSAGGAA